MVVRADYTFLSNILGIRHSGQTGKLVGLLLTLSALIHLRPLNPARPSWCLLCLRCPGIGLLCGRRRLAAAIGRAAGLAARLAALVRASLGGGSEALRCGPLCRSGCGCGDVVGTGGDPRQFGREHRQRL